MKEKRSLIPRGCTVPSLEMRRISCLAAIVATRIEMSGNRLVGIVGILGGGGGGGELGWQHLNITFCCSKF